MHVRGREQGLAPHEEVNNAQQVMLTRVVLPRADMDAGAAVWEGRAGAGSEMGSRCPRRDRPPASQGAWPLPSPDLRGKN